MLDDSDGTVTRRSALKQGLAVASGVVWVAPTVSVVSMTTAAAASAPPGKVLDSWHKCVGNSCGTHRPRPAWPGSSRPSP